MLHGGSGTCWASRRSSCSAGATAASNPDDKTIPYGNAHTRRTPRQLAPLGVPGCYRAMGASGGWGSPGSPFWRHKHSPLECNAWNLGFGPALLRQRNEFRTIFEVHAVDVEPFGAPDEAVAFEDFADGARDAIAPGEIPVAVLEKLPVVGLFVVDVDGGRKGMHG